VPISTGLVPKALMGVGGSKRPAVMPGDAARAGTPTSMQRASAHKKMVSPVLHLKKESIGARNNPTSFGGKPSLAFPKQQRKK